jgi:FkbM family methyltransferase
MLLWKLIKTTLRFVGIEAMSRSTFEDLQWNAHIGAAVSATTLDILRLLVEREFPRSTRPFVLQIGANDGQRGDALWAIRDVCPWQGILVEPQPEAFQKLKALHADSPGVICENVAIGPTNGKLTLYRLRHPDGSQCWDDLTAASPEKLDRTMRHLHIYAPVEPFEVPTVTPSFILAKHGIDYLDILVVDTEGMDAEIIKAFDFERHQPIIVQFELVHLRDDELADCLALLKRHGYLYAVAERDVVAWLPPHCRRVAARVSTVNSKVTPPQQSVF